MTEHEHPLVSAAGCQDLDVTSGMYCHTCNQFIGETKKMKIVEWWK